MLMIQSLFFNPMNIENSQAHVMHISFMCKFPRKYLVIPLHYDKLREKQTPHL
jgi:hypothetical protein